MDKKPEFRLIVEGSYFDEDEAEEALRDPFIEDWVEENGNLRIHNFDEIEVALGIALGDLEVSMLEDEIFEVSSRKPLSQQNAKIIAESVTRQGMFDEVRVEARNVVE